MQFVFCQRSTDPVYFITPSVIHLASSDSGHLFCWIGADEVESVEDDDDGADDDVAEEWEDDDDGQPTFARKNIYADPDELYAKGGMFDVHSSCLTSCMFFEQSLGEQRSHLCRHVQSDLLVSRNRLMMMIQRCEVFLPDFPPV